MANPSHDKGNAKLLSKDEAIELLRDALEHYARLAPRTITARGALRLTAHLAPSTAPEADPEKDFSDWMEKRGALGAGAVPERIFFAGHSAGRRSALASRPAEVDDEGLPVLPKKRGTIYPGNYWTDCDEADPPGVPLADIFTAEQYRQGQHDAVAADRAKEWFVVGGRRVGRTYMAKLAHDAARYRWLRESSNVEAASILDMHSGDSMDARVDQAMARAAAQRDTK